MIQTTCRLSFVPCLPEAEQLVALGFRHWLLGRRLGEICHWERAFDLYVGKVGLCGAKGAVMALSKWTAAMDDTALRELEVFPDGCRSFCRDECLAVSLIAACQHDMHSAMSWSASALARSSDLDRALDAAGAFASALSDLDQELAETSVVLPPCFTAMPQTRLEQDYLPH